MMPRVSLSGANRKTSTVDIRELLNATERRRLLEQLSAKRGVCKAYFSDIEPPRLSVEYDADLVSALGILDFFESSALHAQLLLRHKRPLATPSPPAPATLVDAVLRPTTDLPLTRA
jgi:hypothetical protein